MYEPHQSYNDELSISNKNQYSKLLTADQKIQELEQLMEARDLEREEMKVQLEALQTYKTKGTPYWPLREHLALSFCPCLCLKKKKEHGGAALW